MDEVFVSPCDSSGTGLTDEQNAYVFRHFEFGVESEEWASILHTTLKQSVRARGGNSRDADRSDKFYAQIEQTIKRQPI